MSIYFIVVVLIMLYPLIHKRINATSRRRRKFLFYAFGILVLLAILRSPQVGRDLAGHYAKNYEIIANMSWSGLADFSNHSGYEIGFVYFCKLISYISHDVQWFVAITSIVIYGITARFIYKHSEDVVMSTLLFVLSCSYYMYLTMIRQALAICIVLIAYDVLISDIKRFHKYLLFTGLVLFAALFHQSAILCLTFILFDNLKFKRMHIILALVITVGLYSMYDKAYLFVLSFMGNTERYLAHIASETEGVGGLDWITLLNIILTFGAFVLGYYFFEFKNKRTQNNIKNNDKNIMTEQHSSILLYLSLMAGVFRLLVVRMNILNRVTFYFLPFIFVLYPMAARKSGRFRQFIKLGVYFMYFLYFVYMTWKLAGSYYGVVPYEFFW